MPNELTSAIRAAQLAFKHADVLWPNHSEGVSALALDALRHGISTTRRCVWSRAIEAAERDNDSSRCADLANVFATLGACVNPSLAFGGVSRPTCWTAKDFPQRLGDALEACDRLAAVPPRKSGAEITAELEKRRHTRFPGVRALAREYGINPGDMSAIIKKSAALRGWKARHAAPRVPRVEGSDVADAPARDSQVDDLIVEQARDDRDYTGFGP